MTDDSNVLPFVRPDAPAPADPDITPGSMRVDHHYTLDAAGNPVQCVDLFTWARWFQDHDRRVAVTHFGPEDFISTVFLGLDHNYNPFDPRPILYETMVHTAEGWGDQWRYRTREQALAHHAVLVEKRRRKERFLKRFFRHAKTPRKPVKLRLVA